MRAGTGVSTVSTSLFSTSTLTAPFAVGTRPSTRFNGPTCGAMRTFAHPGSSGVTPSTYREITLIGAAPHAWLRSRFGLYFGAHASIVTVAP